jgi:hypothetical protein
MVREQPVGFAAPLYRAERPLRVVFGPSAFESRGEERPFLHDASQWYESIS